MTTNKQRAEDEARGGMNSWFLASSEPTKAYELQFKLAKLRELKRLEADGGWYRRS